jgi:hypothetical protein
MDKDASHSFRSLLAGLLVAVPMLCSAQGFSADYDLMRFAAAAGVRLAPTEGLGAGGLTVQAGRTWFGQVGVSQVPSNPLTQLPGDTINVGGGYRFGDGQSLSLQFSRARGPAQRLGLAVSYDWPRSFVRFSYDQGLNLTPQDNLRFSAGVRF